MISPKERLQKSPQFAEVAKMLGSPLFEHCCEVAMLTYVQGLPTGLDGGNSVALHQQLVGAKEFLRTLHDLTWVGSPQQKVDKSKQFDHSV